MLEFANFLADCFAKIEVEDKRVVGIFLHRKDFLRMDKNGYFERTLLKPFHLAYMWKATVRVGRAVKMGQVTLEYEKPLSPRKRRIARKFFS